MKLISLIIPCFNEEMNISPFYKEIQQIIQDLNYNFELVFVNDGSKDNTAKEVLKLKNTSIVTIKLIDFSRNFGKEAAVSAGFAECSGDAAMIIDADLQYPVEKIPEFIACWEHGSKHVIGLRKNKQTTNLVEKIGSKGFGIIMKAIGVDYNSRALDFRLVDRSVITEFNRLKESSRTVRVLLDWIGYNPTFIEYDEKLRERGVAGYSFKKRVSLAINSFLYNSLVPLKMIFLVGGIITLFSFVLGMFIFVSYIFGNKLTITTTFALGVFNLFLNGIVITCLGLIAMYIGAIRTEVIGRPLYIIKRDK
jgi:polyisoprenyl-phosphate glycosyltransferase